LKFYSFINHPYCAVIHPSFWLITQKYLQPE
jgi:hypothetical protein